VRKALPHRRKDLLLVNAFLRRLLELHLELVEYVQVELGGDQGAPRQEKDPHT
jgi:hypothetical protein